MAQTRPDSTGSRAKRFAAVGVVNTLIDLGLYALLTSFGLGFILANFISTSAGMTFGFFAHRSYSFRSDAHLVRSALTFVATTGVGLWVVQPAIIWIAANGLTAVAGESALTEVWLPKLAAISVGLVWNFVLYQVVVFGRGGETHERG